MIYIYFYKYLPLYFPYSCASYKIPFKFRSFKINVSLFKEGLRSEWRIDISRIESRQKKTGYLSLCIYFRAKIHKTRERLKKRECICTNDKLASKPIDFHWQNNSSNLRQHENGFKSSRNRSRRPLARVTRDRYVVEKTLINFSEQIAGTRLNFTSFKNHFHRG